MQFPHILVINLKERTDRWQRISQQLNDAELPFERVEGIRRKEGWKGCSLAHQKAIQIANQRNYPWVLLLEDDCLFVRGWKQRFVKLLPILWERRSEWEVFTGGSCVLHKACKLQESPPLFQMTGWCAQFMLIHAGTYPRILRYKLSVAIDDAYRRSYTMWCTYPHLAITTGGWSNNRRRMDSPSDIRKKYRKQNETLQNVKATCAATVKHRKRSLEKLLRKTRKLRKLK